MAKKSKECAATPAIRPERSEMKPRKAVLRIHKGKDDASRTKEDQPSRDKINKHHEEIVNAEEDQVNELENKQEIRAFLKARKARLAERREKKLDDPTATMPEDLPVVKHRSRTKEGYYIYTPDELKMGLPGSGMTDKCPFDCDCCF